jgi:hypothetical protein
MFLSVAI